MQHGTTATRYVLWMVAYFAMTEHVAGWTQCLILLGKIAQFVWFMHRQAAAASGMLLKQRTGKLLSAETCDQEELLSTDLASAYQAHSPCDNYSCRRASSVDEQPLSNDI